MGNQFIYGMTYEYGGGGTRPVSTSQGPVLLQRVGVLTNPINNQWDAKLIREVFHEDVVGHILSIPLREN
jgi:hypothetical protein